MKNLVIRVFFYKIHSRLLEHWGFKQFILKSVARRVGIDLNNLQLFLSKMNHQKKNLLCSDLRQEPLTEFNLFGEKTLTLK